MPPPQVYTALLAFFWAVSNNYVTPVLVPLAWCLLPDGSAPSSPEAHGTTFHGSATTRSGGFRSCSLVGALIKSSALLVGLIVFMVWSTSQDFVPGFSAYPLGMGAAIVVIMLGGELVAKLLRRRTLDLVPEALSIVVVVVAVWMGFALLPAGRELAPVDLLPGVAILVGVWLTWLLFTQIEARHNHG